LLFGDSQVGLVPPGDRYYFAIGRTDEKMIIMRCVPGRLTQKPKLIKSCAEYNHGEQCVKKVFDIFHELSDVCSVWVGEDTD
jgi:hypothetical protein